MKAMITKSVALIFLCLTIPVEYINSQANFVWGKQFGSEGNEYAMNHVTDNNGNIYISGRTDGVMNGKNYGKNDGFITRIDSSGNIIWTRQFGSAGDEDIQWSAIDNDGYVYITGSTTGIVADKNSGKEDVFIIKYNPDGGIVWAKQFGTDSTDIAKGLYADKRGSVYVTGTTGGKLGLNYYGKTDCFIIKLDDQGNAKFTYQFGTKGDDCSYAITVGPDSDIFVCGTTSGDLAGKSKGFIDGFTGHFTATGQLIRYDQFGSEGFDIAMAINVDNEKNIYAGGSTSGNFGSQQIGEGDGFLIKLSEKGDIIWNKQFGTNKNDGVRYIDLNSRVSENILVSGILNLPPSQGFIRMYGKDGSLVWERSFIAAGKDLATSGKDVRFDNKGNFYHMGLTGANLFGSLNGGSDIYLVKFKLD